MAPDLTCLMDTDELRDKLVAGSSFTLICADRDNVVVEAVVVERIDMQQCGCCDAWLRTGNDNQLHLRVAGESCLGDVEFCSCHDSYRALYGGPSLKLDGLDAWARWQEARALNQLPVPADDAPFADHPELAALPAAVRSQIKQMLDEDRAITAVRVLREQRRDLGLKEAATLISGLRYYGWE